MSLSRAEALMLALGLPESPVDDRIARTTPVTQIDNPSPYVQRLLPHPLEGATHVRFAAGDQVDGVSQLTDDSTERHGRRDSQEAAQGQQAEPQGVHFGDDSAPADGEHQPVSTRYHPLTTCSGSVSVSLPGDQGTIPVRVAGVAVGITGVGGRADGVRRPGMNAKRTRREVLAALPGLLLAACSLTRGDHTASRPASSTASTPRPLPTTTGAPRSSMASSPVTSSPIRPPVAGPARFVRKGPADRPAVAFTFHGSGDVSLLNDLLNVAKTHRAPLTIFAVGSWLDANPGIARHISDAGHELANHTYTHPSLGRLSSSDVRNEIVRCRAALSRHAGTPGHWFRPSAVEVPGATILDAAWAAGYQTVVGYDVDPHDYQDPGSEVIRKRSAAGVHPGAIISLHVGHRGTVDALAAMLGDIKARGLRPVIVSDLLAP